MQFNEWLNQEMTNGNLTLQDLENRTGCPKANLSLYRRGKKPNLQTIEKIVNALDGEVIFRKASGKTNFEVIQRCNLNQLATILCGIVEDAGAACSNCPVKDNCYEGHNGFIDWLNKEV